MLLKLQTKIILLITLLLIFLGISFSVFSGLLMRDAMVAGLEQQAFVLVQALSEQVTSDVIRGESVIVSETLQETAQRTESVVNIFIVDFDGRLFAHSFGCGFPRTLFRKNHELPPAGSTGLKRYMTAEGPVLEVVHPLIEGMDAHMHVGMSEVKVYELIASQEYRVAGVSLAAGLFGILLGLFVVRRVTRPLSTLADSIQAFGMGESGAQIAFRGGGREVFDLTQAFNRMITERNRFEENSRRLEESLRQSQKMEAVSRLAGGVAHDLNNMLTPILGYAEIMLSDMSSSNPYYDQIAAIQEASARARDIVRQLLAFSRKQVLQMKRADIGQVVEGFQKMLRRMLREDIEIKLHLDPSAGCVFCDVGQIEQVLMSLAANAQDAMSFGGILTFETSSVELDEVYAREHSGTKPGSYALLAVSDNGIGIGRETGNRIFEPFFTTKESGEETGLGLATVYGIIKQHGGNIWVYSEPGKGATFKIYLPRSEEAEKDSGGQAEKREVKTGTETVLVVEDDERLRKLVGLILNRYGYRTFMFESGEECLQVVEEIEGEIHLLLTDVVMPNMNGRELYRRLVESALPDPKVLYMSEYTDNVIVQHGVLEEGVWFIQKPFSPAVLAAKVREVLEG